MMFNSVYIEQADETVAPPEHVLKVSFFKGGHDGRGTYMQPVVFFGIGDFDENTYEDSFKSSAERQFSVDLTDLLNALGALGATSRIEIHPDVILKHDHPVVQTDAA